MQLSAKVGGSAITSGVIAARPSGAEIQGQEDEMTEIRSSLLRTTLAVNAISTAASGALFVAAAAPLASLMGVGPIPLAIVGSFFVAFAALVWMARREPLNLHQVEAIFAMDVAYVLASVVLLLAWPGVLSPAGRLITALLADVVAVFAVLELVGLRRARRVETAA